MDYTTDYNMENTVRVVQTVRNGECISEKTYYTIPQDKCEIIVNNKRVLMDENGGLFNIDTEDAIDVIKCEVVKNTIYCLDDISFSGTNHKTYNYYTQMYEPNRYVKRHKECIENIAKKFKVICKNMYDERSDTISPVNSRAVEDAIGGLKYDIRQLNEYYSELVENQTFLCYETSGDIIDNMYINDLTRIVDIGLNMNIRCSNEEDNLTEYLNNNAFTVFNLCIKVLMTLEPRAMHSLVIM